MPVLQKHVLMPLVALAAFCFLAFTIAQSKPDSSRGKQTKVSTLLVDAEVLRFREFHVNIESFGTVKAKTHTNLFPMVSGKVEWVSDSFQAGAYFNKGDALLRIEQADYLVELQIAKGNVAQANLALEEERALYDQARRDWKGANQPELATDLALRKPQLAAAKSALETAQAKLTLAELNLNRTQVTAPYDGRVLSTFIDIGSVVNQSTSLAEIYSSKQVEVRLPISSEDLPFVSLPGTHTKSQQGMGVSIINGLVSPEQTWQAKAFRTEASVDASSQQLTVVAEIDSPFSRPGSYPLKIGQYVKAEIQGHRIEKAIVVANDSIYQGNYVYTIQDDLIHRTPIDVLWHNDEQSIISKGLSPGDILVTTPLGQVISGTPVSINSKTEQLSSEADS